MNEVFWVRIFAYSILPLLLAAVHISLDKQANTTVRRIEVVILYLLAISVGINGISGAYGHLFLSDVIAEAIGWPAGNPFQLEMGFANLAIGVLGLMAIGRRDGLRTAAITAVTIMGVGATVVHFMDIVAHGNLAPGNTIQNIGNLLDPILLIGLTWWVSRLKHPDMESSGFRRWQMKQQPIVGMAAVGVSFGFSFGYGAGSLLLFWTLIGTLLGVGGGLILSRQRSRRKQPFLMNEPSE